MTNTAWRFSAVIIWSESLVKFGRAVDDQSIVRICCTKVRCTASWLSGTVLTSRIFVAVTQTTSNGSVMSVFSTLRKSWLTITMESKLTCTYFYIFSLLWVIIMHCSIFVRPNDKWCGRYCCSVCSLWHSCGDLSWEVSEREFVCFCEW